MVDEGGARVLLFEGLGTARVRVGARTFEEVPVVPVTGEERLADLPPVAVLVRAGADSAQVKIHGLVREGVPLFQARPTADGEGMEEIRVRVREVRRRPQGPEGARWRLPWTRA